jgi:hypothetical protein
MSILKYGQFYRYSLDNNDSDRRIGAISWLIGVGPGGGGHIVDTDSFETTRNTAKLLMICGDARSFVRSMRNAMLMTCSVARVYIHRVHLQSYETV